MKSMDDPNWKLIDRNEPEYCQQCKYVYYYDWYYCGHKKQSGDEFFWIHEKYQAETCKLFEKVICK